MTVASSTNRVDYTGNGSTTVFSFTFRIFAATDLVVTKADADGVETVLTLNTDYTVTGVGSYSGGTVTISPALSSDYDLTIQRVLPLTQETDLRNQGQFFAETHEDVFDRMSMINQQLQEQLDRAAKLPVTNTADADALVADIVLLADNLTDLNTIADAIGDIQTVADDLNEATSEIEVVAGAIANVNTVGSNISNVNTVAGVSSNVTTVAGVAANVTTVAGISSAVSGVAAISSAVSAVNSNASNINTVAGNNTNVSTVAGVSSAVTTVAGISSAVSTVAADGTDIGAVAAISADVQAVADIAADVSAVENIAANVTTVAGISANVTTVAGVSSAVSTVAGVSSAVSTVSGISSNVTTVAGISSAVSTVATNNANVSTVASNISAVNTVAGDIAAIITTANDLNEAVSEIEVVANNIADVQTVGAAIADVSAVAAVAADVAIAADNVADIQNFADVYQGASSTAPTTRNDASALQVGDLYFNTTDDQMKVYGGSGWQSVGSTVNGTSQRYRYIATASQTTFTGSDSNSNTLAYDVGFIDVYLNGVRLDQTDYTATSGDSVVLGSGAAASDEINIVTYGNFELADHYNKTDADSRFVNTAGDTMTGDLTLSGNPSNNLHAAPKQYVDSAVAGVDLSTRVAKSGDTMTGNLTLSQAGSGRTLAVINTSDSDRGFIARTGTNKVQIGTNSSVYDVEFVIDGNAKAKIDTNFQRYSVLPSGSTMYPAFDCRAWVSFNGSGTVAMNASGNVSSVTDLGTGQYRVNFTTAMPDANYAVNATHDQDAYAWSANRLTSSVGVYSYRATGPYIDVAYFGVAIFR